MLLVKKLEAVQVHVALHFEGPKRFEWIKILHDDLQGNMWILCQCHKNGVGLMQKLRVATIIKLPLAPRDIVLPRGGTELEHLLRSLNIVHFYFTISARAHQLPNLISISHGMDGLWSSWSQLLVCV